MYDCDIWLVLTCFDGKRFFRKNMTLPLGMDSIQDGSIIMNINKTCWDNNEPGGVVLHASITHEEGLLDVFVPRLIDLGWVEVFR
jgi:hypothetical protein